MSKVFVKCITCNGIWKGKSEDFKQIIDGRISGCKKLEKLPNNCEYITFKCDPCIDVENQEFEKEHPNWNK